MANKSAKPEGISAGDWEHKRSAELASNCPPTRPVLSGAGQPPVGKMTMKKAQVLEAARFSQQVAAIIQVPLTQQTFHNARVYEGRSGAQALDRPLQTPLESSKPGIASISQEITS